jgi:hypothetical protein
MSTKEHLKKIKAKCEQLLVLSEKRTAGKWRVESLYPVDQSAACISAGLNSYGDGPEAHPIGRIAQGELNEPDAAFITACAGPAEAGWRTTIAAIDDWLALFVYTEGFADGAPDASDHDKLCNEIAAICHHNMNHIIAAWPPELL